VVTGTVCGEARQAHGPQGDVVALFEMAFPVRDPEQPQQLWTWASCQVEVPDLLAEQSLTGLQVGAPVLAGGQLGERQAGGRGRRAVIVAAIVHPGNPPSDYPSGLLIPGDG
jgi:uncharacterized protein YcfJ